MTSSQEQRQTDPDRLERLLKAACPCIAIVTFEEGYALELIAGAAMGLPKHSIWRWTAAGGVQDGLLRDRAPVADTEHPAAALFHFAHRTAPPTIAVMLDLAPHLEDARTHRLLRECLASFRERQSTLILIDHDDSLPPIVQAEATLFDISLPDESQIEALAKRTLRRLALDRASAGRTPIEIEISRRGFDTIVKNLRGLTRTQIERIITDVTLDDSRFDEADVQHVLAAKRRMLRSGGMLEYIETPADLSGIGGLARLKHWLSQRRSALHGEAREFGIEPPRGVLLLGVQGAGKSLCAKAVAAAWHTPLFRLDPGALYDRYIGESERRLRETLAQAEQMAPIVLWIDEIEKGFASAAGRSTDGGLSRRMFGTLLTWMQDHVAPVFLIATANDIEALPPELLRKGRFDEIFFVDLPDLPTRKIIFEIHLRKRGRDPSGAAMTGGEVSGSSARGQAGDGPASCGEAIDLDALAEASEGYSGAEIEQAIISALHEAFSSGRNLSTELALDAVRRSPPLSVTMRERVSALRRWAEGRCVPAN